MAEPTPSDELRDFFKENLATDEDIGIEEPLLRESDEDTPYRVECPSCNLRMGYYQGKFGPFYKCEPCNLVQSCRRDGSLRGIISDQRSRDLRKEFYQLMRRIDVESKKCTWGPRAPDFGFPTWVLEWASKQVFPDGAPEKTKLLSNWTAEECERGIYALKNRAGVLSRFEHLEHHEVV